MVTELVRQHDPNLAVVEAAVEQGVPEEDTATRAEPRRLRVGDVRQVALTLDDHLHRLNALSLGIERGIPFEIGRRRLLIGHEVGEEEREQEPQADEDRRRRQPPALGQNRRERHRDQEPKADEEELGSEHDPGLEKPVQVAGLPEPVATLPPEVRELERQLGEPRECEAQHAEQHPGADAAGCRLSREPCPPPGVERKHSEEGDLREQEVPALEGPEVLGLVDHLRAQTARRIDVREDEVIRHRRLPEQPGGDEPPDDERDQEEPTGSNGRQAASAASTGSGSAAPSAGPLNG